MVFKSFAKASRSPSPRLARLVYSASSFRILAHGDHVLCALSGVPIALDALRYWSAERQQAYASAVIAVEAMTGRRPAAAPEP